MASRATSVLSKNRHLITISRNNACSTFRQTALAQMKYSSNGKKEGRDERQHDDNQQNYQRHTELGVGVATAVIMSGVCIRTMIDNKRKDDGSKNIFDRFVVFAEDGNDKKLTEKEMNLRRTQTLDKIFDYFATYRYINKKGKNVNLMSIKDFYNAITPGSTITHGSGMKSEADYLIVNDADILSDKIYQKEEIPSPLNSILNKIQRQGLLSYTDFCFLMNILATPRRYLDIAFLAFDITADGQIDTKEYLKVMSKITKHTGGLGRYDDCGTPEELITAKYSGLMSYLFGPYRTKKFTKDAFLKFRGQIIDDILWLEFTRYCKDLPDLPNLPSQQFPIITDAEFCEHLLAHANIHPKKKAAMIKRVTRFFGESSTNPTQIAEGITFDMFKSFYQVLFCGDDLERAMHFRDLENGGVTKKEFMTLSKWISGTEVDEHVVDVVFLLLDEDGHQLLSIETFAPLLSEWRHSRAFMQASTPGAGIIDLKLA